MEEIIPTEISEEDVSFVLGLMEQESSIAGQLHKAGIDTELTKTLRNFMAAPHELFISMNQKLSDLFPTLFIKLLERNKLLGKISRIGFSKTESSLSFWVYLKPDFYNFQNRGEIYEAHAALTGIALFSTIRPHLLVLKEGEIDTPKSFSELKLS